MKITMKFFQQFGSTSQTLQHVIESTPMNSSRVLVRRIAILNKVIIFLVISGALALIMSGYIDVKNIDKLVGTSGISGGLIFVAVYAIATVGFLPGLILTLAGGAIFGPVWGTILNLTGATLGATCAFLVSRYFAADWVSTYAKKYKEFEKLLDGVASEGWRFVAFVRLVPLFPFNALNYLLGLTRINLIHYVITSFICMIPAGIAYTYLGYIGRQSVTTNWEKTISNIFLALGLLVLAAYLPRLIKKLRTFPYVSVEYIKEKLNIAKDPMYVLDVRNHDEFVGDLGHIKQAHNIPLNDLNQRLHDIPRVDNQTIAIVCRTDRRSLEAAKILKAADFNQLMIVKGGMTAWNQRGFPRETVMVQ